MSLPLNPAMRDTDMPPVMEARRWLDGVTFTANQPLINVSQAAPVDPPPLALRKAIAEAALNDPAAHLYGPVLGLPALRAEIAAQWSAGHLLMSGCWLGRGCPPWLRRPRSFAPLPCGHCTWRPSKSGK